MKKLTLDLYHRDLVPTHIKPRTYPQQQRAIECWTWHIGECPQRDCDTCIVGMPMTGPIDNY